MLKIAQSSGLFLRLSLSLCHINPIHPLQITNPIIVVLPEVYEMSDSINVFTWQGANRRGHSVKGEISAKSLTEAKHLLRRQGISAQKVKKHHYLVVKKIRSPLQTLPLSRGKLPLC